MTSKTENAWMEQVIRPDEIEPYLIKGRDFIDDDLIHSQLEAARNPEPARVRDIIAKSLELRRLEPEETAALIHVTDPELLAEMRAAAGRIKDRVYGGRIVTFAPLYLSNYCVNSCVYCGYRKENRESSRKRLTREELLSETRALVDQGHKRLIMVYGEHPLSGVEYIEETLEAVYSVKKPPSGEIRRANINAAPMDIASLERLKKVGIGTFQVFQETYHHETYQRVHPRGIKADYRWRLYALHRCMDAGVDDIAPGVLFGLYDWRFEVMGLLYHTMDLESRFGGVGPHTISFPRMEPAVGTAFTEQSPWLVTDEDFERIVTVIRLSVPYTGMILTARETPEVRERILPLGITQLDFGSNIGVGSYARGSYDPEKQQFLLNDQRSLDEGIAWLAREGHVTSFCTAGYRCGRTGDYFMQIAKQGKVHRLCMPNAITTFAEYLEDYAGPETRQVGWPLVETEIRHLPEDRRRVVREMVARIKAGERDVYV